MSEGTLPPSVEVIEHKLYVQKVWSDKVHAQLQQELYASASLRDKIRLQSEKADHAGAWISVVPNDNLDFHFDKGQHQLLTNFHLGIPILPEAAAGAPCDGCGQPLDVYGDHLVSCRLAGAWDRHNQVGSAISAIATAARLGVSAEVQINGKQRPADLLLSNFENARDAALDLTIVHALPPSAPWDPNKPVVEQAEAAKLQKYQGCCDEVGVDFYPVGIDTFGAFGTKARELLGKLFHKYAGRYASEGEPSFPGQLQQECWQRVSVALRKAVATQLSAAFTQLGGVVAVPFPGDAETFSE
jgi:hypothetical protein